MKQITLHFFSLLILALSSLSATAYDFEVDGIYYNINGTEATVTYKGESYSYYSEYTGDVTIPETVTHDGTTYSVTTIGDWAFSGSSLTGITIPNSITSIGKCAFFISGLNSISIPNSVTFIGDSAFYECGWLTSVEIGNSVTSIGNYLFYECINLTSVTIPDSVTFIGSYAFYNCSSLTNISIPNSVTFIGSHAFNDCSGVTSITAPSCYISNSAFENCTNLKSASVGTVGDDAFNGCNSLRDVVVNGSIGERGFYGCPTTMNVTLINTVVIGTWAFPTYVHILPSTLRIIDYYAFGTPGDPDPVIYCMALDPPLLVEYVFPHYTTTVYVPNQAVDSYRESEYWKDFTIIGVGSVPHGTVFDVDGIYYRTTSGNEASVIANEEVENNYTGNVVIPDSVTYEDETFMVTGIEKSAFEDCYELTSVVIGDAVETIGENAFQGCSDLTRLTIGSGVTNIGAKAFNYCNALQTVTCRGTVPPVMANANCFSNATYSRATLLVPRQQLEVYQVADYWSKFSHIEGWGSAGMGDVNADGTIDISDVTALTNALLTNSTDPVLLEYGDLNNNGRLDIGDVTSLIFNLLVH